MSRATTFLAASKESRAFHRHWASAPATLAEYRRFVQRVDSATHIGHFVIAEDGVIAGVININEVVRGAFASGYLGYYALSPYQARGYMHAGLKAVIQLAFGEYKLHRLEANIQPDNPRSIGLVRALGFRLEGYSAKYLKIRGRWRDHERWALTAEDWKGRRRNSAPRSGQ
jgi:ribosomal-protein-alanine N-acetyltransferase